MDYKSDLFHFLEVMWYKLQWIYVWADKVRPSGWKPWANTLAYFPFKDDILDTQWTYTLSNNWNSKETIWYKFTSYALINIPNNVTPKTTSMWAKPISIGNSTRSDTQMATLPNFTGYYLHHKNSSLNQKYVTFTNSSYASVTASASVSFNQRYLFTTVYDGTKSYGYINGVKVLESAAWYRRSWNPIWFWEDTYDWTSNYVNWQCILSDCIVESEPRTADEILKYFNQTKSNYWL